MYLGGNDPEWLTVGYILAKSWDFKRDCVGGHAKKTKSLIRGEIKGLPQTLQISTPESNESIPSFSYLHSKKENESQDFIVKLSVRYKDY